MWRFLAVAVNEFVGAVLYRALSECANNFIYCSTGKAASRDANRAGEGSRVNRSRSIARARAGASQETPARCWTDVRSQAQPEAGEITGTSLGNFEGRSHFACLCACSAALNTSFTRLCCAASAGAAERWTARTWTLRL